MKGMFEVLGVRRCEIVFIVFEFVLLGRKKVEQENVVGLHGQCMLRALLCIWHILGDSFVYKCFFSVYCVLSTLLGTADMSKKPTKKDPCLLFDTLEQGLANFFCTEADNVDCKLCEPGGLCCNYSTL